MSLSQTLILGIVQGLTEFLPISSTAHLILIPKFFNFPDPGLVFDISLHLGTLLAILIYFRKEWRELIIAGAEVGTKIFSGTKPGAGVPSALSSLKNFVPSRALLFLIIIATVPGLLLGALFESKAETIFRSPILIAATLSIFGLILWLVDKKISHLSNLSYLNKRQAIFIGLCQALAIIPGVSRSGATMTGGLLMGLTREAAVKFSFLLSAPIIAGSVAAALLKVSSIKYQVLSIELILGVLASFISGLLAIKFLFNFVQKHSFLPFVIYRLVLAFLILFFLV